VARLKLTPCGDRPLAPTEAESGCLLVTRDPEIVAVIGGDHV
jgi:hypothetical protein